MKHIDPGVLTHGPDACGPTQPRPVFVHDRWQALSTVKAVARTLGLGEREITVLSAHLSVLAKGPVRSDQVLISYAGLPTLLERANCMDERRFRRGEARLEQAGLIRRKFSANARRFPVRDNKGMVVDAYGIDLRPLFERIPELSALQQKIEAAAAQLKATRTHISARLSEVRRSLVLAHGETPEWFDDLVTSARNILRRAKLTQTEANILQRDVEDALDRIDPPLDEVAENEMPADISAGDPGQIVRHSESQEKDKNRKDRQILTTTWCECSELASYHETPPESEHDLLDRLYCFGGYLGLSHDTRVKIVRILGILDAMKVMDYMAKQAARIKRPDCYVVKLLDNLSKGGGKSWGTTASDL